jgi:hypothetical protein
MNFAMWTPDNILICEQLTTFWYVSTWQHFAMWTPDNILLCEHLTIFWYVNTWQHFDIWTPDNILICEQFTKNFFISTEFILKCVCLFVAVVFCYLFLLFVCFILCVCNFVNYGSCNRWTWWKLFQRRWYIHDMYVLSSKDDGTYMICTY